MNLLDYWPTQNEINNCIRDQAENASDEVLLAVHQEFPIANFTIGPDAKVLPDSKTVANEEELLLDLISENVSSGAHVVPITGASGAGKSHLIRILDARLRRIEGAERYLVIRIPKSASLRRVVELILEVEPLKHKKYDVVKSEFKNALEDVPLHEAVIRFQAQLEISLLEYGKSLHLELKNDPSNSELKERLGHAQMLPKFLADAAINEHFREKVLPRIIQRAVEGGNSEGGISIDPTDGQFKIEDFDPEHIDIEAANTSVSHYYKINLLARNGRGTAIAVEVLNKVVDQTTRQLYHLNQSLGGMTIGEVILEIRRVLLGDNKELILLIEDFYALVGIQDTLAKVLIQEGDTSKGKEYATIRSAIAVTDGYLVGRDTLATRAGREWVVESRLEKPDDVLARTKALVASYLNAARCGEAQLKKHYQTAFLEQSVNEALWHPPLFAEDQDQSIPNLSAFGFEKRVPLFPFTDLAIESLSRATLKSGGELVFNPRFIIKNVIRDLLLHGRKDFENGKFPNAGLIEIRPSINISEWLRHLSVADHDRKRYQTLVTIWGNNPKEIGDIDLIPKEVFDAFGLEKQEIPVGSLSVKPIKEDDKANPSKAIDTTYPNNEPQVADKNRLEFEKKHQPALNQWAQSGIRLDQSIASEIRIALSALINARIDWNAERCIKRDFKPSDFSIPHAGGEANLSNSPIKTCCDEDYTKSSLPTELQSLLRYSLITDKIKIYPEVSDDLVRIANLVERLLPQALKIVRYENQKRCRLAVLALSENSMILGKNETNKTLKGLRSLLFSAVNVIEELPNSAPQEFLEWRDLQKQALKVRPRLLSLVVEVSGCFRGTGVTPYGIDIARIFDVFTNIDEPLALNQLDWIEVDLRSQIMPMSFNKVKARAKRMLKVAKEKKHLIDNSLGISFNKEVVSDELEQLAEKLAGVWRTNEIGLSKNEYKKRCVVFKTSALSEISKLDNISVSEDDIDKNKQLAAASQLRLLPLLIAVSFVEDSEKLIYVAKKHSDSLESQYEGINPIKAAQEVNDVLERLICNLTILQQEKNDVPIG